MTSAKARPRAGRCKRCAPASCVRSYGARIELVHKGVLRMPAGETCAIEVLVRNLGDVTWPSGDGLNPLIRVGLRWVGEDGEPLDTGMRTYFDAPIAPGSSALVLVYVTTPERDGRHRLWVDLVHEGVRWFGAGVVVETEVET